MPLNRLLLLACLAAACATGDDPALGITRADSSGVKIITSGATDTALTWKFEEVGVLRDSSGAPWLFNNIWRFTVLTDRAGRTYVLTRDPSIVRFDREGKHDLTLGRQGGGPGEFQFPMGIGSKGDTIVVVDAGKRAFVRFLPDLSPTSDQRLEGALERADMIFFRTGGVWFRRMDFNDTMQVSSVWADTAGPVIARTAITQGGPVRFKCVGISASAPIFAPQVNLSASVARLLVNAQPGYELQLFEGPRLVGSVRRPLTPRAPTADDTRLLYPEGMIIRFGEGRPPCIVPVEEVMKQQGVAKLMPFIFDVALHADGTMWALRTPTQAPPVVDVFGPDGIYAGTMRGRGLPLARLPNGELLFAKDDEESGGKVIVRVRVTH